MSAECRCHLNNYLQSTKVFYFKHIPTIFSLLSRISPSQIKKYNCLLLGPFGYWDAIPATCIISICNPINKNIKNDTYTDSILSINDLIHTCCTGNIIDSEI